MILPALVSAVQVLSLGIGLPALARLNDVELAAALMARGIWLFA